MKATENYYNPGEIGNLCVLKSAQERSQETRNIDNTPLTHMDMLNLIKEKEKISQEWKLLELIFLFKKGDKTQKNFIQSFQKENEFLGTICNGLCDFHSLQKLTY